MWQFQIQFKNIATIDAHGYVLIPHDQPCSLSLVGSHYLHIGVRSSLLVLTGKGDATCQETEEQATGMALTLSFLVHTQLLPLEYLGLILS